MATAPEVDAPRRTRVERLRCTVCEGVWTPEQFKLKKDEFDSWNPARVVNPHHTPLNKRQIDCLCAFFTPAGELSLLCRKHLRSYGSVGTVVLNRIKRHVMGVASTRDAQKTPVVQRERGGQNKFELDKNGSYTFFRQWLTKNTHVPVVGGPPAFNIGPKSVLHAYQLFVTQLFAHNQRRICYPTFTRALATHAPGIVVLA